MIIGVLSDTHGDKGNAIPHIIKEFKKRKVELIIHCGDIEERHLVLFDNFPIICALNEEQKEKPGFKGVSENWQFTSPNKRILDYNHIRMYVGHKRSFDFLAGSEQTLINFLNEIRKNNDGLRWVFCGHTHHQIFVQTRLTNLINPGSVENSFDGYEFAIINTEKSEIVFSRLLPSKPNIPQISVCVISDSLKISKMDPLFWKKLAAELEKRGVKKIIHCGNIALDDVGHSDLKDFDVFFNLREDQRLKSIKTTSNWDLIPKENPIVNISDYNFYVKLDLGADLLKSSEIDMHTMCLELRRIYHDIDFLLCGFTNNALLVEEELTKIINPGDIIKDRNFAVITLPQCEIVFDHIPFDPLPSVT